MKRALITGANRGIGFAIAKGLKDLGLITPPLGLNLFIINSMAKDTPISATYRGALPFVVTDIIRVVILAAFPAITLWLVWAIDAL